MPITYKLEMVEQDEKGREIVCLIGYFGDEEKLERWAKENRGELKKCE